MNHTRPGIKVVPCPPKVSLYGKSGLLEHQISKLYQPHDQAEPGDIIGFAYEHSFGDMPHVPDARASFVVLKTDNGHNCIDARRILTGPARDVSLDQEHAIVAAILQMDRPWMSVLDDLCGQMTITHHIHSSTMSYLTPYGVVTLLSKPVEFVDYFETPKSQYATEQHQIDKVVRLHVPRSTSAHERIQMNGKIATLHAFAQFLLKDYSPALPPMHELPLNTELLDA